MRPLLFITALVLPISTSWATDHILTYQEANKWVAQQDAQELKALLEEAKKEDSTVFHVILPEEKRPLAIARLKILRDILDKSLSHGVLLEEKKGETPPNTLTVTPQEKASK